MVRDRRIERRSTVLSGRRRHQLLSSRAGLEQFVRLQAARQQLCLDFTWRATAGDRSDRRTVFSRELDGQLLSEMCARPGSRTPNLRILSPAPLPVGLDGRS